MGYELLLGTFDVLVLIYGYRQYSRHSEFIAR